MVDPITVSVVQHRLGAIVEEMGEAMLRTSYSQILNSSRDFSTGICYPDGRLVAQAEHVPIHVGALPWAAKAVYDYFGESIHPGDVFLLNDPYRGGNHLPDLTAFVPVFDGDRFAFWSINRSHQSDIGGATHGAYNPLATEIWQEGVRIPPLRLYERGRLREDVYEMIVLNVRHPRDFRGDVAAMIGSARVGERRLDALIAELGSETTHAAVEAVLDGAERQARAVIAEWPDGEYEGVAHLDDDGHGFHDIHICARVTKRGSELRIDLSDSHPQVLETEGPAVGNTAGDGVKYPACGMNGGKDALPHLYILRSRGRRTRELKTKEAGIEPRPGDVIHVRSGGGGGWGDPGERSAVARQRDLRDGFVTSPTSSDDAGDGNTASSGTQ